MATIPTFNSFNKSPGVYIEEITVPGPLPQVSTSVAAIIGPAQQGPLNTPTLLTAMTQFNTIFGSYIENPYRCYAAHAVNGFFNEGGQQCYFVRVGNGKAAWLNLLDQGNLGYSVLQNTTLSAAAAAGDTDIQVASAAGINAGATLKLTDAATENATVTAVDLNAKKITLKTGLQNKYGNGSAVELIRFNAQQPTLRATALQEGNPTVATNVTVANTSLGSTTTPIDALTADAAVGDTTVAVGPATTFLPGDSIVLAQPSPSQTQENAIIASVDTSDSKKSVITLSAGLANAYATKSTVSIANLPAGAMSIRVASVAGFQPGSYVQFSTATVVCYDVVRVVNPVSNVLTITNGLSNAYAISAATPSVTVKSMEFTLTVNSANAGIEVFKNLAMDPRHSQYYGTLVNSVSKAITLGTPLQQGTTLPQPDTTPPPLNTPANITAAPLAGGLLDDLTTLGAQAYMTGIDSLIKYDVDLLCVPDAVSTLQNPHFQAADTQAIQAHLVQHCEKYTRFAILDCAEPDPTDITFTKVSAQRQGLNSNNGFGALYFPWIGIASPFGSGQIFVPPSGHLAGVYAQNDNTFDAAHAPANEPITSALSVEMVLSSGDQGPLNQQAINVIRSFPSQGILVWGARTISPPDQTAWRYINVRRLLNEIEKTLLEGTRFAVFQPNNLTLWKQVKRLVTDYLTGLWQAGDLFGATADQAFLVRVDATLNTPVVVALGQLIIQVTVVPTHPAEFVVFQVIQDPTGATLAESTAA